LSRTQFAFLTGWHGYSWNIFDLMDFIEMKPTVDWTIVKLFTRDKICNL